MFLKELSRISKRDHIPINLHAKPLPRRIRRENQHEAKHKAKLEAKRLIATANSNIQSNLIKKVALESFAC